MHQVAENGKKKKKNNPERRIHEPCGGELRGLLGSEWMWSWVMWVVNDWLLLSLSAGGEST